MSTHIEGFEVPLHRALAEPILLGGSPRSIAIVNGTLAAVKGLGPIGDYVLIPAGEP